MSSPLISRNFIASKEAELLGLSLPLFENQNVNPSHIGAFLNKRSSKSSQSSAKQQKQQQAPTMTTKQQKKQDKNQIVSSSSCQMPAGHQFIFADSIGSASQIQEEDSSNSGSDHCIQNDIKQGSCCPNSKSTPSISKQSSISKKTSCRASLFSLEASLSGSSSTAAPSMHEDIDEDLDCEFFDKYDIEFTKKSKKFKVDEDHHYSYLRRNLRKDSMLSNCSETTHLNWNDKSDLMSRKTSMDFNLTPINSCSSSGSKNSSSHNLNDIPLLDTPHLISDQACPPHIESDIKLNGMSASVWEVKKLVEQRMGRLAAEIESNDLPCCTFTIRCFLKHTFSLTADDILNQNAWCVQCEENLNGAQSYAAENSGVCLNSIFEKTLHFRCEKNHEWDASHLTFKQRWCSTCRQIAKDQFKQYYKEQEAKKQAEYERSQEEIYREARERAMREQNQGKSPSAMPEDYSAKVIAAAKQVELEVQKLAEAQAESYMSSIDESEKSSSRLADAIEVMKIILFPEQILSLYFTNLPLAALNAHYRNVARNVHPDKNKHPKAGEAFQKLHNFYSQALPNKH